ncbi:MAG: hypothetical protein ACREDR_07795 [Blastocatellia bacterium]
MISRQPLLLIRVSFIAVWALVLASTSASFGQERSSRAKPETIKAGAVKPEASSANLQLTFNPDPVPASTTDACFGVTPAWLFSTTIAETAGVGVTITGYTTLFYDSNDNFISPETNSGADFAKLFGLPTPHIAPNATVSGTQCAHLAGRSAGKLVQVFSGMDDNGNQVSTICGKTLVVLGPVGPGPDLQLSLVSSGDSSTRSLAVAGMPLLYTGTITNQGPGIASGVRMTMAVPGGTAFDAVTASQGSCTAPVPGAASNVDCVVGSIGPGSTARIWILVDVTKGTTSITSSATASASLTDPDSGEDSAVETSSIVSTEGLPTSDMSVTASGPGGGVASGTRITYAITVQNVGKGLTTSLGLIDFLPAGATFFSIDAQGQACTTPPPGGAGAVVCGLDSLNPGDQRIIHLTVNVLSPSGSSILNTAKLIEGSATQKVINGVCSTPQLVTPSLDPNPANNTGTAGNMVQGGGTVALSWQQPPATAAQPTPAPFDLQAKPQSTFAGVNRLFGKRALPSGQLGGHNSTGLVAQGPGVPIGGLGAHASSVLIDGFGTHASRVPAGGSSCTLTDINIYKSDSADVMKIDPATGMSNLWMTVPPDNVQTTMAAAPGGSFYAIANLWNCGGMIVESGLSNEQNSSGTLTTPQITNVVPMGRKNLLVEGQDFSSGATITSNGSPKTTIVQTAGSVLVGKKLLKKLRNSLGSGHTATLRVDNGGGALSNEYTFTIP